VREILKPEGEDLRMQLMKKLPHYKSVISKLNHAQLEKIYDEAMLNANQTELKRYSANQLQRNEIFTNKSDSSLTELFELKGKEKAQTMVLIHS
jgi:hypothetical protein